MNFLKFARIMRREAPQPEPDHPEEQGPAPLPPPFTLTIPNAVMRAANPHLLMAQRGGDYTAQVCGEEHARLLARTLGVNYELCALSESKRVDEEKQP